MKKFYLLIILLVSGFGFGQVNLTASANYHAIVTANIGDATGDGCCCGGLGSLSLDGIGTTSVLKDNSSFWENTSGSFERDYTESNLATSISLYSRRRTRSGGCKVTQEKSATVLVARNQDITYKDWDDANVTGVFAYNVYGTLRVQTYPIINLSNPDANNNIIGTDSSIKIPEIDDVLPEYFNWMYHIEGEQYYYKPPIGPGRWRDLWRSLPAAYQGKNSLNILCSDFLPVEAVGKKITLRANVNGTTVELLYAKSAPHIDMVDAQQTKCFDTNDGRAIMKFSSKLAVGETLRITVLQLDEKGMPMNEVYSTQPDESVVIGDDLTYEIPYNFLKSNYRVSVLGWYKEPNKAGANTYVMDPEHRFDFKITSPAPVDFTLTKKNDINCYGGSDGAVDVTASGGVDNGIYQYTKDGGTTWITFLDGNKTTISNLGLGKCFVKVRKLKNTLDTTGCIAKDSKGVEKESSETIDQPAAPLALASKVIPTDPMFYKAENGKIIVSIKGGTLIGGKTYSYQWKNSKNETIDAGKSFGQLVDNVFTITLKDVPADTYRLTVTDERGCTLDPVQQPSLVVVLDDPEPIKINLKVKQNISCNSVNLGDEGNSNEKLAADGILVALVEGGKILEPKDNIGLPYYFYWKKLNAKGEWDDLGINDSIAPALSAGTYSINVKDANGIMHGIYTTAEQTPVAVDTTIVEPNAMEVQFSSRNVSCFEGQNGWAEASIKNGTSTYAYTWYGPDHNGVKGDQISNLAAGTYYVDVEDTVKGCFVKASVIITEPTEEVKVVYEEIVTPTFSGATNGKIVAKITGGTPFDPLLNNGNLYNYKWTNAAGVTQIPTAEIVNGVFTITLNGVPADDYFLTIEDKNYDKASNQIVNCSVLESKVKLTEPDPLKVVFEVVRAISCNAKNEFGSDKDTTPKDNQRDESQDGILTAHVTGGTPLASDKNNGLPYYFYWKKQKDDGSWDGLSIQDSIAPNLSHGNYALNVKDGKGIVLGTYLNNQLVQEIDVTQLMQEPPKLDVTITKGDVFCNGGNDGWATANVTGGIPPYDYKWSNEVESEKNTILKAGEYWVFITDAKGCTTQESVTIIEPALPLAIKYTEVLNPSFYKATNGKIVVEVTGGTIFSDNSYWFEWKNSKGIKQTSTTAQFNNGIYTISLNGLPEETYNLTIRDANYDAAINKAGCTMVNSTTSLDDPDPLEVTFEIVRTISCNVSNEFGNETDNNPQDNQRDESQDGILTAHVKGGIQLEADKNKGLPYFYTWKKKQNDGSWKIWNDQDGTLENISEGTYALNIEDANGIKLGTYVNNILVKETDVIQYIEQPAKLNLTLTKFNASCNNGGDGWAEALVTGGTAPYTYEWTNGETTAKIENITANNYFVLVTDAKGCVVQGSIFVGDPKGILTTETVKNPICYNGSDGSIELNVTGGNLPYSYLWNTGATTKDLKNLKAGNYEVTISCPDCCVYKKRFTLKDPNPIEVDLGKDRTLCNDQVLELDAAIADQNAQYSWTSTNGFTSYQSKVSLTKAGTYHVKVTSGLGCIGEDEIVIKTSQAIISSEFLLSSQAYLDEEVILVNTSNPFGESTKWVIPKGVKIIEEKEKYITLKFDAIGVYSIGLQQTQGDCYAAYNKSITVEQRSTLPKTGTMSKFITDFIVTPNPSNGNFTAIVNLENSSAVNLRLFSTSGEFTMQKKDAGKKKYEINFNTSLQSGMYILVLETEQQTLVKKIIIY